MRKGLCQMIESADDMHVLGEASDGDEAIKKIAELNPDVAVLDIEMPKKNGFEVASAIQAKKIPLELIFLTMHHEEDIFNRAMDIGVKGFVLKENSAYDIVECIRNVLNGKYYISPLISDYLIKRSSTKAALHLSFPSIEQLTTTEKKVLVLIAEQKTSKEIAELLHVSHRTVENHRTNIANKLNIHGINGLLKFAIDHKSHLT
ncbi:MAG: response regulator transcription factor [Ignavibacteriae bacterium]|nr:response regulator transcription factor [Ignavibacteriota bacterium]